MQKILTKYWLMLHVATLTVAVALTTRVSHSWLICGVFWLVLMTLQCAAVLPALRRGESLAEARVRGGKSTLWDPLFYVTLVLTLFALAQVFNSNSQLTYFPESDLWLFSDPHFSWLPSSVDQAASILALTFFVALMCALCVLRHTIGRDSKRLLLQILGCISGLTALISTWGVLNNNEVLLMQANEPGALNQGSLYGFWLLVTFGVYAEKLERRGRGVTLVYALAFVGNIIGVLFFADPLSIFLFLGSSLLLFIYWLLYLRLEVPRSVMVRLILMTLVVFVMLGLSIMGVFKSNPGAHKINMLFNSEGTYLSELLSEKELRSSAALDIWRQRPWAGVGPNGYHHYLGTVVESGKWRLLKDDQLNVRNDVLQMLCEGGVIGLSLVAALVIVLLAPVFYRLRVAWKKHKDPRERSTRVYFMWLSPIVVTSAVALIVLILESFYCSPLNSPALRFSWFLVLATIPAFLPSARLENK